MSDVLSQYDTILLSQLLSANELELEDTKFEIPTTFNLIEQGENPNNPRFRQVEFSEVDKFLEETENENTKKKTISDMRLFKNYLTNIGENSEIENLSAESLNEKFSTFLLSVTKKDGTEYEPSTLRGFLCSLDRYHRQKKLLISM